MRRLSQNALVCSLLALVLLGATSQYLVHFHVQAASAQTVDSSDHSAVGHCSLCVQFDRLPAPPATAATPVAHFFPVSVVDTAETDRFSLETPQLWPPARAPPDLTC